ncbi:MAG: carbonic anhydrase family protein [Chloroflexi bacterium]|nr:carbonic anhydrase family protein [Chloroflexota bacterium]MCY3865941.1 carbonic anhydrase family protein [Chloroflexota bacterium]
MKSPKRRLLFATLLLLIIFVALLLNTLAADIHWGYSGDAGPAYWGELSPDYVLCADGSAQSPIDIRDASALDLVDIDFRYGESANNIFNNGHTIQVNVDGGSAIVYNGITYELLQFHFHSPSEHTIDGMPAPLEIHFVHQDPNSGNLAVVGIMLTEGDSENEAYAAVFDHLPAQVSAPEATGEPIVLAMLLPEARTFYTYQGSLTTPPCSEIVRWLLLDQPVALSARQIAAFRGIYDGNARPVQELGARDLLLDSK